ncbi:uncharacterized protein TNCV_865261 [Trichonephila clavipes]|nr:uncharacterized protein TNCV_865261 [Trichonephila clavipes]
MYGNTCADMQVDVMGECLSSIKHVVGFRITPPVYAKAHSGRGSRVVKVSVVACLVTSSSPVPLKTRRVGQRCTLNLSRAETSPRWCGVVVRRGGASSGVVHVT